MHFIVRRRYSSNCSFRGKISEQLTSVQAYCTIQWMVAIRRAAQVNASLLCCVVPSFGNLAIWKTVAACGCQTVWQFPPNAPNSLVNYTYNTLAPVLAISVKVSSPNATVCSVDLLVEKCVFKMGIMSQVVFQSHLRLQIFYFVSASFAHRSVNPRPSFAFLEMRRAVCSKTLIFFLLTDSASSDAWKFTGAKFGNFLYTSATSLMLAPVIGPNYCYLVIFDYFQSSIHQIICKLSGSAI